MNLESVSVEHPRFVPCLPSLRGELKQEAAFGNDGRGDAGRNATEVLLKQILIEIALEKIAAQGLCGAEHVGAYLMDLYRRNCRPNTIRSRFATIWVFLQYLKARGRNLLQLVCREDLCAFIEHEQDRGLKPASVRCRIDALYAFIRFLVDRDVLSPDLLRRKLRVKVPNSLPRAIDPQDVRWLLAVIRRPRDRAMVLTLLRTGMRIRAVGHNAFRCGHGRETHRDL
jgi:hypothetical protein